MSECLTWGTLSADMIEEQIKNQKAAILPLGAIEDHGPHLPSGTDYLIAKQLCRLLAEQTGDLLLPPLTYTYVWSLGDRPGTISLSFDTLRATIREIAQELYRQGIKTLICVDAHIGNTPVVKTAFRDVLEVHPDMKCMYFAYLDHAAEIDFVSPRASKKFIHACEIETSVMLFVQPEMVRMEKAAPNYPAIPAKSDYLNLRWGEFTKVAVLGNPQVADREKGEQLVRLAVEKIAACIEEERNS